MAREHFTGSILGDIIRATNGVSSMTVDQRQQNALYGIHQARVRIPDDGRPYRLILSPADVTLRTPNGIAIDEHFADRINDSDSTIASSVATPPVNQDAVREAREEGYRAGYRHVLGLARTGVPTEDFERDVGAYMADYVSTRP